MFPNILSGIILSSLPPRQILRESPAKNNNKKFPTKKKKTNLEKSKPESVPRF